MDKKNFAEVVPENISQETIVIAGWNNSLITLFILVSVALVVAVVALFLIIWTILDGNKNDLGYIKATTDAPITIPPKQETLLTFNTIISNTFNNNRATFKDQNTFQCLNSSGTYQVQLSCRALKTETTGQCLGWFRKNNQGPLLGIQKSIVDPQSPDMILNVIDSIPLSNGDYFQVFFLNETTSDITFDSSNDVYPFSLTIVELAQIE